MVNNNETFSFKNLIINMFVSLKKKNKLLLILFIKSLLSKNSFQY